MNSYIFITIEGYTFQPESESIEQDIENCQVIGFAKGKDANQAFQNLTKENPYLLDTTFDELISIELKHADYDKHAKHFHLAISRCKELTNQPRGNYKLIISDIDAGGGATIDLYYDDQTNKVKETKTLADKTVLIVELALDDFHPSNYGHQGVEFLRKINTVRHC